VGSPFGDKGGPLAATLLQESPCKERFGFTSIQRYLEDVWVVNVCVSFAWPLDNNLVSAVGGEFKVLNAYAVAVAHTLHIAITCPIGQEKQQRPLSGRELQADVNIIPLLAS